MSRERELLARCLAALSDGGCAGLAREIESALSQPESDPVGYVDKNTIKELNDGIVGYLYKEREVTHTVPLYTHPPRQQVALSDDDLKKLRLLSEFTRIGCDDFFDIARAIERAHGIGV